MRAASGYDWTRVRPFRDKEEAGHEEPWYAYLRGTIPGTPCWRWPRPRPGPGGGWR
jgi:hypothetical protein